MHFLHYENPYSGLARYVTAQPPTQGADAGMYDASSEIYKLSTETLDSFQLHYDCPRNGIFINVLMLVGKLESSFRSAQYAIN